MKERKNKKKIAGWQTTRRSMAGLWMIPSPMAAQQIVLLFRLARPTDPLYKVKGKELITPPENFNLRISRAHRMSWARYVMLHEPLLDADWLR